MEVVTYTNEAFKVVGSIVKFIVHTIIIGSTKDNSRIMVALSSMEILLGRTYISQANHQTIISSDAIEQYGDNGILTRN